MIRNICMLFLTNKLQRAAHRYTVHNRFLNLSGQKGARLDADQSIHGIEVRTNLIKAITPFLFWNPDVYLENFEKIWVNNIMSSPRWNELIARLNSERQDFMLIVRIFAFPLNSFGLTIHFRILLFSVQIWPFWLFKVWTALGP